MSNRFHQFQYGQVKPTGWLNQQMRMHADALLGNMDRVSENIRESLWLGGSSANYDDLPLWLQGFVPLAYALNDQEMKKRAKFYFEKIIENNRDHWIKTDGFDIYSLLILMNTILVYAKTEEYPETTELLCQMLKQLDEYTNAHTLSQKASLCWFDALPVIMAVRDNFEQADTLAKKLKCMGFDWLSFFENDWQYDSSLAQSILNDSTDNAHALRAGVYLAEYYQNPDYLTKAQHMHNELNTYHSTCAGTISGAKILSGKKANAGMQIAAISEYMCSCAALMCSDGDVSFSDRLEFLAFNAYPAAFSHDLWAIQPVQAPNQVLCENENSIFGIANENTAIFGKGLAAYASNCFVKTENGIALTSYAPCTLETTIEDKPVKIECISEYPFKDEITIRVSAPQPCTFDLELKMPEWAEELRLSAGSDLYMPVRGTFYKFTGIWYDTTDINLCIRSSFKLHKQTQSLYAAIKGPLLYAIPLTEQKKTQKSEPYADFELHTDDSYGYAFEVDYKDRFSKAVTYEEKNIQTVPFSPSTPPIEMYTCGRRIQWPRKNGAPLENPLAVPTSESGEMLRFIPYGATNLRMTLLPVLKK